MLRPRPAGGANCAPPNLLAGFLGEERNGKMEGNGRKGKERAMGKEREMKKK